MTPLCNSMQHSSVWQNAQTSCLQWYRSWRPWCHKSPSRWSEPKCRSKCLSEISSTELSQIGQGAAIDSDHTPAVQQLVASMVPWYCDAWLCLDTISLRAYGTSALLLTGRNQNFGRNVKKIKAKGKREPKVRSKAGAVCSAHLSNGLPALCISVCMQCWEMLKCFWQHG